MEPTGLAKTWNSWEALTIAQSPISGANILRPLTWYGLAFSGAIISGITLAGQGRKKRSICNMLEVLWALWKRGYHATIRTCQKFSIWKTYQNFKSEDNDHLLITNCNQACFAKLAPRGLQEGTYNQDNNTKSDGDHNIKSALLEISDIRGSLVFHLN